MSFELVEKWFRGLKGIRGKEWEMHYNLFDAFTLYKFYGHQLLFYFGIYTDIFVLKEIFWGWYLETRKQIWLSNINFEDWED